MRWREPPWRSSACLRGNHAATRGSNALALRATIMTTIEKTPSQLPLGMIPSFSQAVIRPQCCMCTEDRANKTCLSRRSVIAPAAHNAGCMPANQHRADCLVWRKWRVVSFPSGYSQELQVSFWEALLLPLWNCVNIPEHNGQLYIHLVFPVSLL